MSDVRPSFPGSSLNRLKFTRTPSTATMLSERTFRRVLSLLPCPDSARTASIQPVEESRPSPACPKDPAIHCMACSEKPAHCALPPSVCTRQFSGHWGAPTATVSACQTLALEAKAPACRVLRLSPATSAPSRAFDRPNHLACHSHVCHSRNGPCTHDLSLCLSTAGGSRHD